MKKRKKLRPDNVFDYITIIPKEKTHESGYKTLSIYGFRYNHKKDNYDRHRLSSNANIDNVKIIGKKIKKLEITVDYKNTKMTTISALHKHVFYLDKLRPKIDTETAEFKLISKFNKQILKMDKNEAL